MAHVTTRRSSSKMTPPEPKFAKAGADPCHLQALCAFFSFEGVAASALGQEEEQSAISLSWSSEWEIRISLKGLLAWSGLFLTEAGCVVS